jgi:RHS repeat-associated protein
VGSATSRVSYSVDANGAMTSDGLRTFESDESRRLSKVKVMKDGEAAAVDYLHNALGQRVFKSQPLVEQTLPQEKKLGRGFIEWLREGFGWLFSRKSSHKSTLGLIFAYDEDANLIGEYDNGSAQGLGSTEYIWLPVEGANAIPVGMYRNGKFYQVHSDHLGTPRLVTDSANQPVWQWPYSAFGNNKTTGVLAATTTGNGAVTLKATKAPVAVNLRFPGQYFDEESNLANNGFRSYRPFGGDFMQMDPIGLPGGFNRRGYVYGNPLTNIDPDGRMTQALPILVPIVIVGCALSPGCRDFAKNWMESRSRGKGDPVVLPPVNPGRDCDGNCKPCPPGVRWFVDKPGHGHENGYWHEIRYNQDLKNCMCYPDRPSTGLQGF